MLYPVGATLTGRCICVAATSGAGKDHDRAGAIISPRMDFEQWTPLGRGDPLKNDPTFDYLPPVLDKVLYWKSSAAPPPPPPAPAPVHYNRRFFLTEFSRKEPAVQAYAPYKRTVAAAPAVLAVAGPSYRPGYVAWPPKTPLPMLTPPPYQRAAAIRPIDPSSFPAGDSTAESKQPPAVVRAPPPHPVSSHSFIKTLLDAEVDRTTVTTTAVPTTVPMTMPTTQPTPATQPTPTTQPPMTTAESPSFAHYRHQPQPPRQAVIAAAAADKPPMYLIIQGHSKVKTYGPYAANKQDDLQSSSSSVASHDHNHVGHDGPDRGEPSRRRKRGGGGGDGPTTAG